MGLQRPGNKKSSCDSLQDLKRCLDGLDEQVMDGQDDSLMQSCDL